MSKLFLDLKKFNKVKEGKEHTVFTHKDGHEIHVKNNSLSPKMKEEMMKLAMGGKIDPVKLKGSSCSGVKAYTDGGETEAPNVSPAELRQSLENIERSRNEDMAAKKDAQDLEMHAAGGNVGEQLPLKAKDGEIRQKYANGTDEVQDIDFANQPDPNSPPPAPVNQEPLELRIQGEAPPLAPQHFEQPTIADTTEGIKEDVADIIKHGSSVGQPLPSGEVIDYGNAENKQSDKLPPPAYTAPPSPGQATPGEGQSGVNPMDPYGMRAGINQRILGVQQQAAGLGQLGKDTAQAYDINNPYNFDYRENQNTLQDAMANNQIERQAIAKELSEQKIDPNAFIADKSVPGKMALGIGLILGGMGGGLAHQGNPALDFLNKQIDRNIEGQKLQMDQKKNLLAAHMDQFKDLYTASQMLRVNHLDQLENQVKMAAAKAQTPLAQAQANMLIGQIKQETGVTMAKINAMTVMNHPSAGEADIVNAINTMGALGDGEKQKELQSRYLPGIGTSTVSIPQATRDQIIDHQKLEQGAADLEQFMKSHTGSWNPRDIAIGKAKVLNLQQAYREGTLNTVYREGEAPLLQKAIGNDPTSFFNSFGNIPKIQELRRNNAAKAHILLQGYNVRPFGGQQQQSQQPRWVPRTQKPLGQ
jgi:hypothetical protein